MSRLESILRHDARLNILGNLAYGGPCTVKELSERVGIGIAEIGYHLAVLDTQNLVAKDESDLQVATLEDHPSWVEECVTVHRFARRVSLRLRSSAMLGLKCDHCNRLLRYGQRAVAVYRKNGTLRAKVVTEETPGSGEADELAATSKYHTDCYEQARGSVALLPPVEP